MQEKHNQCQQNLGWWRKGKIGNDRTTQCAEFERLFYVGWVVGIIY
jgi:hypothetical protein